MQDDGNFVVYPGNHFSQNTPALWHTYTYGHPGASLIVQNDGDAAVYTWGAVWSSGTQGR
jgi:hypothetical protein